jgi:hypothetical protein
VHDGCAYPAWRSCAPGAPCSAVAWECQTHGTPQPHGVHPYNVTPYAPGRSITAGAPVPVSSAICMRQIVPSVSRQHRRVPSSTSIHRHPLPISQGTCRLRWLIGRATAALLHQTGAIRRPATYALHAHRTTGRSTENGGMHMAVATLRSRGDGVLLLPVGQARPHVAFPVI